MAIGDVITGQSIADKYSQYLNGLNSYVWSLQNYPSYFPTAYLASGPLNNSINPPPSSDIMTAFLSIANAVKNTARALTAIVTCRYVLKYNNNGVWRVDFDQTQKALFNSSYLLNIASNLDAGNIIFEGTLNNFYNSVKNEVVSAQNRNIYLESTYCHTSCFTKDTRLNLTYKGTPVVLSFEEFDKQLDTTYISEYLIESPEGYVPVVELYNNGEKDVFLINEEIECTIDHKFIVDKETNKKIEIGFLLGKEVETIDGKKTIKSIEYIGKKEVYDLEVGTEEHRYIIKNYIVSNCHSSCFSGKTKLEVEFQGNKKQTTFKELSLELFEGNSISDYKINTPEGYLELVNFYRNGTKELFLVNGEVETTLDHKFVINKETNKKIEIGKLINKEVETIEGKEKIFSIVSIGKDLVYDLEVRSKEHRYYVNNKYIVSNCHSSRGRR